MDFVVQAKIDRLVKISNNIVNMCILIAALLAMNFSVSLITLIRSHYIEIPVIEIPAKTSQAETSTVHADPDSMRGIVRVAAIANNLDPEIMFRLVDKESNWDQNAKSSAEAYGLFQLRETAVMQVAPERINDDWRYDIALNSEIGCKYFRWCMDRFEKLEHRQRYMYALIAYNWGIGNVRKWQRGEQKCPESVAKYVLYILGSSHGPTREG